MELFPYRGTWIACGAYAFLQVSGIGEEHLIEIENCAGATFGMKSSGREWDYTRILTPFRDFNCGIDDVAHLWGFEIKHDIIDSKDSFCTEMFDSDSDGFVFGPVNMEGLRYLVLPQQYHLSDHYFAVKRLYGGKYVLYDSEGICGMNIELNHIKDLLNIANIPEAEKRIHIRTLYKQRNPVDSSVRLDYEMQVANKNFHLAEESGHGSKAFLICQNVITEDLSLFPKWRESVYYNLNYVAQRRLMMLQLVERVVQKGRFFPNESLCRLIMRQIQTVGECFEALEQENINIIINRLNLLYETEGELVQRWENWIK